MNAPTRSEFLARRRNGIGGSEIAAILGLSKYQTPLDVYLSKVNDPEDVEDEQSEPAYWGTVLAYIGMALALLVCVAAAALVADYWTDLTWARDVLAAVVGSLR